MSGMRHLKAKPIWVARLQGTVSSTPVRRLAIEDCEVQTVVRDRLDVGRHPEVGTWMNEARPDAVILTTAKMGGVMANDTYPADLLYENLMIEVNIIRAAHRADVEKLLFLSSPCIHPNEGPQSIPESALLSGPPETTNGWYAIAKTAVNKLAQAYRRHSGSDFVSAMPTTLHCGRRQLRPERQPRAAGPNPPGP